MGRSTSSTALGLVRRRHGGAYRAGRRRVVPRGVLLPMIATAIDATDEHYGAGRVKECCPASTVVALDDPLPTSHGHSCRCRSCSCGAQTFSPASRRGPCWPPLLSERAGFLWSTPKPPTDSFGFPSHWKHRRALPYALHVPVWVSATSIVHAGRPHVSSRRRITYASAEDRSHAADQHRCRGLVRRPRRGAVRRRRHPKRSRSSRSFLSSILPGAVGGGHVTRKT